MNLTDFVTACGACNGRVIKARSITNETVIIDADPVATGNIVFTERFGKPIAHVLSPKALASLSGPQRYASHFATCRDSVAR